MEHKHHVDHVKQHAAGHMHEQDKVAKHKAGHKMHHEHVKAMCGGGMAAGGSVYKHGDKMVPSHGRME